ncbi:MAG: helix-turn-helix transcriptional regulator [Gammaproteobacteria bacterium]
MINPIETKKLIRRPKVEEDTGLSCSEIYRRMSNGTFPRPTKIGATSLWVESEVQNWINERIVERDTIVEVTQ